MSCVVTLATGTAWTSTDTIPDPGHTDPGWQREHGLVPETVPWDEYPGWHMHEFCEYDSEGEVLSVGQRLAIPALHQNPETHGAQLSP